MGPYIRDTVVAFFTDKTYFEGFLQKQIGRVRGFLLGLALAAVTYGDQLTAAVDPAWAPRVKLGGVCLAGLSVMLRAGDKTPENVKALANSLIMPTSPLIVPPGLLP